MVIRFNAKIYNTQAIKEAIKIYADTAKFKLESRKGFMDVSVDDIAEKDFSAMKDEFSNYVLFLTSRNVQ